MDKITREEQIKYRTIWSNRDYSSGRIVSFAKDLRKEKMFSGKILEIGAGTGHTAMKLIKEGYDVTATDITGEGLKKPVPFHVAPAWELPFEDNTFDSIYSTDVLEHIPPVLIPATLKELNRVLKPFGWQFHKIATFAEQKYDGYEVHLTVKPLLWWYGQFMRNCKNFKLYKV